MNLGDSLDGNDDWIYGEPSTVDGSPQHTRNGQQRLMYNNDGDSNLNDRARFAGNFGARRSRQAKGDGGKREGDDVDMRAFTEISFYVIFKVLACVYVVLCTCVYVVLSACVYVFLCELFVYELSLVANVYLCVRVSVCMCACSTFFFSSSKCRS
jgi:hypothetical protein